MMVTPSLPQRGRQHKEGAAPLTPGHEFSLINLLAQRGPDEAPKPSARAGRSGDRLPLFKGSRIFGGIPQIADRFEEEETNHPECYYR
jgi:hypothetical protein